VSVATSTAAAGARVLGPDAVFLVWGPPTGGPRSRVLSRALDIEVRFLIKTRRHGVLVAPFKYGMAAVRTVGTLLGRRRRVVFVQSPPSPAVLVVWLCCALTGARFVVDAHSDAMLSPVWTRPRWLLRFLARRAETTIVTNEHFAERLRADGADALVIPDVPTTFSLAEPPDLGGGTNAIVVTSFAPDEPIAAVLEAARELRHVRFHVTGDVARADPSLVAGAPDNVTWTGFLPDYRYYALMAACDVVVCLTTRDHTMQRGACEALALARPIVTSDWPVLRGYFARGARYADNSAASIRDAVAVIADDPETYDREIADLRMTRREECDRALAGLVTRLAGDVDDGQGGMAT
jgi:glycosyltransferase involved in cell wall biosynthesis